MSEDPILAAIAALSKQLTELERDLRGEVTGLRGEVTSLRGDMGGWMERVENKLTAIHDDIGVNFAVADNSRKLARNVRDETDGLAEVVAGMQRQIHRLQTEVNELKGKA